MRYEAQLVGFWERNQQQITIGVLILFIVLAFTKRKFLTFLVGILSTVLVNQVFSQIFQTLSYEFANAVNSFLYSHGITQLGSLSPKLALFLLRPLPFLLVVLFAWLIKRFVKRVKRIVGKIRDKHKEKAKALEAAKIKAQAEAEQQRLEKTRKGILNSTAYQLNILPFIGLVGSAGKSSGEFENFSRKLLRFVLNQERICQQLDAEAKELQIAERTKMHQK